MKLALHRSITFWSGILAMAFIGWAWVRSMGHGDVLFWVMKGGRGISVVCKGGEFNLRVQDSYSHLPPGFRWASEGVHSDDWFPTALKSVSDAIHGYCLEVAYWFLILLFLIPWTLLLFWRVRRRKRRHLTSDRVTGPLDSL